MNYCKKYRKLAHGFYKSLRFFNEIKKNKTVLYIDDVTLKNICMAANDLSGSFHLLHFYSIFVLCFIDLYLII